MEDKNLIQSIIQGDVDVKLNLNNLDAVIQADLKNGNFKTINNDFFIDLDFYDLQDVAKNLLINHHDINNVGVIREEDLEDYSVLIQDIEYMTVIDELSIVTAEALNDFFINHDVNRLAWLTGLAYCPSIEIVLYHGVYTVITQC